MLLIYEYHCFDAVFRLFVIGSDRCGGGGGVGGGGDKEILTITVIHFIVDGGGRGR